MSTYADEGTTAHALAAMCLTEGKPASAYIGRVIESEDYEHAKLSPSGAHRWMRCPGSFALEQAVKFTPRKFTMQVDADMAEGVQHYLDLVASRIKAYEEAGATVALHVEVSLPVHHLTGEADATGSGDAVLVVEWPDGKASVDVIDLKFGRGVEVSAVENEQLRMYGSGALGLYGPFYDFKSVHMTISQPRITLEPSCEELTIEEMQKWEEHCRQRASHALATLKEKEGAVVHHLYPGVKQCRFCKAATCPKRAEKVAQMVFGVDDFETLPAEKEAAVTVPVGSTDVVRLAQWYELLPLVEGWCTAVAAEVEGRILSGEKVPGCKVVQGRKGNRAWTDPVEAEQILTKRFRLKVEEAYKLKLISPTDADKLHKEGVIGPKQWKQLLSYITQAEGKPTVVPESDKRPPLEIKPPGDDFEVAPPELTPEDIA